MLTILISFAFVAPKARASKMLNLVNYRLKVTLFVPSLRFALSIRFVYLNYLIRILFIVVQRDGMQERWETVDRTDVGV